MVHAAAFYGLNIFAVEVSVMIQTKSKMLYTTQRPQKTAEMVVMVRQGACFIQRHLRMRNNCNLNARGY
jgi:hypothetical protein